MAAPNIRGGTLVLLKFRNTLSALPPPTTPLSFLFRSVHASVYEKNLEEQVVQPSIVPDYVIPPQPDHYWAPDPHTGVFGPAKDHIPGSASNRGIPRADSVLEQKTFFRPSEDLDKPMQ